MTVLAMRSLPRKQAVLLQTYKTDLFDIQLTLFNLRLRMYQQYVIPVSIVKKNY